MQPRVQPVSPADAGPGGSRSGRPRWIALLIVVPLFVAAGLIYTGGPRLGQSTEQLAGFDIESTTTTVGFTGDLTAGWSGARLGVWGRFVDIVDSGDGLLAVEQTPDGTVLWSSTDGATWLSLTELDQAWVEEVAGDGSGLVAVGSKGGGFEAHRPAVWTSVDGVTWGGARSVPTSEFYPGFEAQPGGSVNAVARTSGGLLVAGGAAGEAGALWYSSDGGDSWELAFKDPVVSEVFDLLEGSDGLIAVGHRVYAPCLWRSGDGITWERDESTPISTPDKPEYPWQLLGTDAQWLALGGDRHRESLEFEESDWPRRPPVLWTSSDARTWTRDLIDELTNVRFTALVEGGPGFVAAGFEMVDGVQVPGMWWSSDGYEWEGISLDDGGSVEDVIWWGDRLVAVGHLDFGPSVWIWDTGRAVEVSGPAMDEFLDGVWADRGLIAGAQLWNPQRLDDDFVAFGEGTTGEGAVWRSPDGFLWSSVSFEEAGLGDLRWAGELNSHDGPPYYLSGWSEGDRWALFVSDDGLEWSELYRSDASGAGGLWAVNDDRLLRIESQDWESTQGPVYVSDDAVSWVEIDFPEPEGFVFGVTGWGSDFFALSGAGWGEPGLVWRLSPENSWEPVGDPGIIEPWNLEVVSLDEGTRLMVWGGQGASLYEAPGSWRSLDVPVPVGANSHFEVQPLRHGLLGSIYQWSEVFNWPVRFWYTADGVDWMELPPLPSSITWGASPVGGFDGLALFEFSVEGTRLWEWQGRDARSRVGSK